MFAIHQGHGDFGRIVLAPGNIEESIKMTAEAFNYAERYQLPVIMLGEKAISQGSTNIDKKTILDIKENYKPAIVLEYLILNYEAGYRSYMLFQLCT